jgi:hypothetical protein
MAALSLAWTAAFTLLGLAVLRLRMPRPARAAPRSAGASTMDRPSADPHHQTLTAAATQTSGDPREKAI